MLKLLLIAILSMPFAHADIWSDLEAHPGAAEVVLFKAFSPIPRPSKGEAAFREWIINLSEEASVKKWRRPIHHEVDNAGNLLIRVPGTGALKDATPIALQSHLDMVFKVKDDDKARLARMHAEGVHVVETDGWLHSANYETTLGADNGMGVALALRYLVDPTIEHPPLELIFTIDEEKGMTGAQNMVFDLKAKNLINLDSEDDEVACRGCIGGADIQVDGDLADEAAAPGSEFTEFELKGFPGGHSGVEMWDDRPSAILFALGMIKTIMNKYPSFVRVASFNGGDPEAINAIPSSVRVRLASPRDLSTEIDEAFTAGLATLSAKNRKLPRLVTRVLSRPGGMVLDPLPTLKFIDMILKLKEQVITRAEGYPHGVMTTSNIGHLEFKASEFGIPRSVKIGILGRSFSNDTLADLTAFNVAVLSRQWPGFPPKIVTPKRADIWIVPPDSPLIQVLKEINPKIRAELEAGGLEVALLAPRFPHMLMISIGSKIEKAHSENEHANVASVARMSNLLETYLQRLSAKRCEAIAAGTP